MVDVSVRVRTLSRRCQHVLNRVVGGVCIEDGVGRVRTGVEIGVVVSDEV